MEDCQKDVCPGVCLTCACDKCLTEATLGGTRVYSTLEFQGIHPP